MSTMPRVNAAPFGLYVPVRPLPLVSAAVVPAVSSSFQYSHGLSAVTDVV